jgi:hypothetical protein
MSKSVQATSDNVLRAQALSSAPKKAVFPTIRKIRTVSPKLKGPNQIANEKAKAAKEAAPKKVKASRTDGKSPQSPRSREPKIYDAEIVEETTSTAASKRTGSSRTFVPSSPIQKTQPSVSSRAPRSIGAPKSKKSGTPKPPGAKRESGPRAPKPPKSPKVGKQFYSVDKGGETTPLVQTKFGPAVKLE